MPAWLSPDEEQSYMNLLGSQAAPYQAKATDASQKVKEFWASENWKKSFQSAYKDETSRFYAQNEINHLIEIADAGEKKILTDIAGQVVPKPTLAEMENARNKVRENPLNRESLKFLQDLELKSQNMAMVAYLETRVKEKQ